MPQYSREEFQLLIDLTKEHGYWTEDMIKTMDKSDPWTAWFDFRMSVAPDWFAWGVLLCPISMVPLFINDTQKNAYSYTDMLSFKAVIARWRLKVGK